jgi:hypothetical protein
MEVIKGKEPIAQIARKHLVSDANHSQMAGTVLRRRQSGAEFREWNKRVAEPR